MNRAFVKKFFPGVDNPIGKRVSGSRRNLLGRDRGRGGRREDRQPWRRRPPMQTYRAVPRVLLQQHHGGGPKFARRHRARCSHARKEVLAIDPAARCTPRRPWPDRRRLARPALLLTSPRGRLRRRGPAPREHRRLYGVISHGVPRNAPSSGAPLHRAGRRDIASMVVSQSRAHRRRPRHRPRGLPLFGSWPRSLALRHPGARDRFTFAGVIFVLGTVAVLACLIPRPCARRMWMIVA